MTHTESSAAVSVIVPTHNRPELLPDATDSLLRQTRSDWEAIIVDDGSTPAARVPNDPRIRLIRHESSTGGAACKNTGIRHAGAPVLAFLDDDDRYAPDYLERALSVLDRNPDLDVLFMGVAWFGSRAANSQKNYDAAMVKVLTEARGTMVENGVISFGEGLLDALLKSVPMGFQRPVVRRAALERVGPYRPSCLLWDSDWAISAALKVRVAHVADPLYLQRSEGQGYFSQGDRRIDQMESRIETFDRLLADTRCGRYPRYLAPKFQRAAAVACFDLAWHYCRQRDRPKALMALWRSESRQFSLANLKLLLRLL